MTYKFQSTLHRNSTEMHRLIAESYMTAGGWWSPEDVACFFATHTDAELADDAIMNWELTDNPDFDREELIAALKEMRS